MNWRSLLFIPADRHDFIARAGTRGADAVILDLEDGVANSAKMAAREGLRQAQAILRSQNIDTVMRVNAQPEAMRQDLEAAKLEDLAAVLIPKCECADDVVRATACMDALLGQSPDRPGLLALIETPLGVLNAAEIAQAPGLIGLVFGSEDYASAMGVPPDPVLLMQPASYIAMTASAYGLLPIGLVGTLADFSDPVAFADIVRRSKSVGLKAAAVIHPSQVAVVNTGFAPAVQEIAHARRVVEAFEAALAQQAGATAVDGRMVDQPVYERAKKLLHSIDRWQSEGS